MACSEPGWHELAWLGNSTIARRCRCHCGAALCWRVGEEAASLGQCGRPMSPDADSCPRVVVGAERCRGDWTCALQNESQAVDNFLFERARALCLRGPNSERTRPAQPRHFAPNRRLNRRLLLQARCHGVDHDTERILSACQLDQPNRGRAGSVTWHDRSGSPSSPCCNQGYVDVVWT